MSAARNYFAWQARLVTPHLGRRVLEAGCGIGNFTGELLDRDFILAIDSDPECIAAIQSRYANHANFHAQCADVENLTAFVRFQFDSAVCLNVLEHIEDDASALRAIARVLVPNGTLVLLVPAFPALMGPIDRNLGHYRRYSRSALQKLVFDNGFRIQILRYVNAVGFFGWGVNSKILKRESQSPSQIAFFDRFVVPALSLAESFIHPPFGQSLLAVLSVRK